MSDVPVAAPEVRAIASAGLLGSSTSMAIQAERWPLVLLGIGFAALAGYAWLDPARRKPSAGARETSGGRW